MFLVPVVERVGDVGVGVAKVHDLGRLLALQAQHRRQSPVNASSAFSVTKTCLDRGKGDLVAAAWCRRQCLAQGVDLDGVAQRGAGAVHADQTHCLWTSSS